MSSTLFFELKRHRFTMPINSIWIWIKLLGCGSKKCNSWETHSAQNGEIWWSVEEGARTGSNGD